MKQAGHRLDVVDSAVLVARHSLFRATVQERVPTLRSSVQHGPRVPVFHLHMNWNAWRRHFDQNAQRPLPDITPPVLPESHRLALAASLAKFQLGESGEGRIAHDIDSAQLHGIDDDYRASLKRFVAEEGRHARVLGLMVNALGGRSLARQWTERLFVRGRRALGVRFKLLVLLAAEVIGISFYGVLAKVLPACGLRDALEQLCADEEHHLAFHAEFFGAQRPDWLASRLLWLAWWPLALTAGLVVFLDHRRTLRVFGVSSSTLFRPMWSRIVRAGRFGQSSLPVLAVNEVG